MINELDSVTNVYFNFVPILIMELTVLTVDLSFSFLYL